MTLTSIKIKNFQSLRAADIELGRVTVIVGQNDLGKSALFRAVRAASEATQGTDFVTYGAAHSSVELAVDDHIVLWGEGRRPKQV